MLSINTDEFFLNEVYFVYNVMLVSDISKKQCFSILIDYIPFKVIIKHWLFLLIYTLKILECLLCVV